ncbi:probable G-protein coupled receptor 21 [Rhopilema esculentum]|uniref:probable G-protein coupled receptor 21 n=1 Tax=Rhopilema esculentum TaxID=499914 RepID=UPI0031DDFE46|eukprot:gene12875-3625_t
MSDDYLSMLILAVAIIIANITEIIFITKVRRNMSLFQLLLFSLAVADLLVGISGCCIAVLELNGVKIEKLQLSSIVCFAIAASVNHVNAITIDRLLAVRWPLKHKYLVSRKRISICIAVTWCVSIVMLLPMFVSGNDDLTKYILSISILTYSGAMVFVYSYIIYRTVVVRRKTLITVAHGTENAVQTSKDVQLVVVVIILTIIFMVCSIPFCVYAFITEAYPRTIKDLLISNSLCNPFVYFFWKLLQMKFRTTQHARTQKRVTQTSEEQGAITQRQNKGTIA